MVMTMLMAFTFTSCGDDDDNTTCVYHYGVTATSTTIAGASELAVIKTAYENALKGSFTLMAGDLFQEKGKTSEVNAKVKAACQSAENTLSSTLFSGTYVFTVNRLDLDNNSSVVEVVYTHTF
jgi:hypothetical protein